MKPIVKKHVVRGTQPYFIFPAHHSPGGNTFYGAEEIQNTMSSRFFKDRVLGKNLLFSFPSISFCATKKESSWSL